jgi:hypothetical protein
MRVASSVERSPAQPPEGGHGGGVTGFGFPEALPTRYEAANKVVTVLLAGEVARLFADGKDPD